MSTPSGPSGRSSWRDDSGSSAADASAARTPLDTIGRLYGAFRMLDAVTMRSCYADDARFDDPVFSVQGADRIGDLWRMLCESAKNQGRADWRLDFGDLLVDGQRGHAHWEPRYRFGATGRRVHNHIDASFVFDEHGLILRHVDEFDLWTWSRQALGVKGMLLGWMPWFHTQLRRQAARHFDAWRARPPGSDF
jgi:hypothetical protein